MNTKMMSQFKIMDTDMLACVEGGDTVGAGEVVQALGVCTIGGAALGVLSQLWELLLEGF